MNQFVKSVSQNIGMKMALDARYYESMRPEHYHSTAASIHEWLVNLGVAFEGQRLPVSLHPTLLLSDEVDSTVQDLTAVRDAMGSLLAKLIEDIRACEETPLTNFFAFYRQWFDLIAGENRTHPHIMLMRFDAAMNGAKGYMVMEPNAACPGGVIHCAYIRDAWRDSSLGRHVLERVNLVERGCDNPDSFVRLLYSVSQRQHAPCIALCNYKGVFANELSSIASRNEFLLAQGEVDGEIIICDIQDLSVHDGKVFAKNRQIDVVYNKVDHLMIDPNDPAVLGWVAASRIASCVFLNSLAALYIGEAKSIFAALWDSEIRRVLDLSDATLQSIERRIPRTRMMRDRPQSPSYAELVQDRHKFVAKADAMTREAGVYVGRLETANGWGEALLSLSSTNAVIQDVIEVPIRHSIIFDPSEQTQVAMIQHEHWGVDFFFFGDDFGGVVGRCHSSMIFNVGNGGQEVPTFVIAKADL